MPLNWSEFGRKHNHVLFKNILSGLLIYRWSSKPLMYVGKASNANPTSSYPPCHASMAWGPTICICEMSVWCWEAL